MKRALAFLTLAGLALAGSGAGRAQEEPDTGDAQDVVFLGEKRPVFLRLYVRHGETSAFAGYDAFLARMFMFLDRDKSGALNRTEAKQVPHAERLNQFFAGNPYLTGTPGRPGMMAPGGGGVNIEELDADKDGSVSLEELKTYYAGKGVGALLLSNQTATDAAAQGDDAIFGLIDRNRDGKLSRAELLTAGSELLRLDQDDDELLTVGELGINRPAMFTPVIPPRMMPKDGKSAKAPEPKFVIELLPRGDRRLSAKMDVARKIVAKYDADKDGKLTSAEIGWEAKALTKWDRNRDGKLDSLELGRWLSGSPESEHVIQLSATPTAPMPRRMRPMPTSSDTLTLGNVQLAVVTQALTGSQAFDFKGQVLGQFRALDVDRHGYLTRRQLDSESGQALRGMLDMADRNNDSRLSREELTLYLDLVASAVQAQVSITLSTSGQGLYGTLDRNGDGFLSVRELREAWTNLAPFAPEKADALDRKDLPNQVRLTVGRGGNQQQVVFTGLGEGASSRPIPTKGPMWFRKMDTNGDGDLSAREWLGDPAQFAALDTDKDGLISLAEAMAYDAAQRK